MNLNALSSLILPTIRQYFSHIIEITNIDDVAVYKFVSTDYKDLEFVIISVDFQKLLDGVLSFEYELIYIPDHIDEIEIDSRQNTETDHISIFVHHLLIKIFEIYESSYLKED